MRLQLLSDLHMETQSFHPEPAADAEVLVLAGDIDTTWRGLARFRDWPVIRRTVRSAESRTRRS